MKPNGVWLAFLALSVGVGLTRAGDASFHQRIDPVVPTQPAYREASPDLSLSIEPGAVASESVATEWYVAAQESTPTARFGHAMAYDSRRGRVVAFGGSDAYNLLADTWEWSSNGWVQRTPAQSPSIRANHAMAYDSARGRTVLFGGWCGSAYDMCADTWEWDGNDWVQRSPATRPPARAYHAMVYDSARDKVVLFGGSDPYFNVFSDTWEWDGNDWVQRSPATRPPARVVHAMTFDSVRGRVVLFGGADDDRTPLADTWEWNGIDWVQGTPTTNPPARFAHAMTFDSVRGRVVLFGGADNDRALLADTWEWNGTDWVERGPLTSPPARSYPAMVYDSTRGRVVLSGGFGGPQSNYLADTWEWDGSGWIQRASPTSPPARYSHAMAGDAVRGRVVLFGGYDVIMQDTWEWDGVSWMNVLPAESPSPRAFHAMAYDSARGRVVLFGGRTGAPTSTYLADTWEWDGRNWVQKTPATSPPARCGHAMAYDRARGRVVLFGGTAYRDMRLSDTWEWDGSDWVQRMPATSPSLRTRHAMAYDSVQARVMLFGGSCGLWEVCGDTWEWDGTNWLRMTPAQSPPARHTHAMAEDSARGRVILFGGVPSDNICCLGDTWEWDGSSWVQTTPAASPRARLCHAMAYDSVRSRVMLFGGVRTVPLGDTWEYGPANQPPIAVCRNVIVAPDHTCTASVGAAQVDGGSYDPDGDEIALDVSPPGPYVMGTTAVLLTVTDSKGASASCAANINVEDTTIPVVTITYPTDQVFLPTALPLSVVFEAIDGDGTTSAIINEIVKLQDCTVYDGLTYGDMDGLLEDEAIELTQAELCRVAALCGFTELNAPVLRVEASDCGGNVGMASRTFRGGIKLFPGICGRRSLRLNSPPWLQRAKPFPDGGTTKTRLGR